MPDYQNIFDTHAHYADSRFDDDREQLLGTVFPATGIRYIMLAGIRIPDCYRSQELARQYDYIYCSAGLHPSYLDGRPADWLSQLRELARFEKCRAIGEIGLDYHRDTPDRTLQKTLFIEQLKLALELDLPVILHIRDAIGEASEILHQYQPRGVMHCYNGSAETAKDLLRIPDLYFSFSGVITYQNTRKPLEALAVLPMDRILIETDSPYLTPEPFRSEPPRRRCDSTMILRTAQKAAEIKQLPVQKFLTICCENGKKLFRI